jgi:5-methyltetrahydrofolate--homocysteine methyltransferase
MAKGVTMIEVGKIDRQTAARYMGMKPGDVNDVMEKLFDEAEELLLKDSKVAYVCDIEDVKKTEEGILVDGTSLVLKGNDMAKLLNDCEKVVVMCATISGGIDTRIRSLQVSNMPLALVYDACASVAVDQVCDNIQLYVREQLPEYVQTMRFSPGYGDLPLEIQPEILRVLDAGKRAGISLTEGGMMVPVKSITAVFGLKPVSAVLNGEVSTYIPKKCGDESVCSKCKAGASCHMKNRGGV